MGARIHTIICLLILLQATLLPSVHALSVLNPRGPLVLKEGVVKWQKNCNDPNPKNSRETKRQAVERAWSGALELNHGAWKRFDQVTWPRIERTQVDKKSQEYINKYDPGYVQFFALDSSPGGRKKIRSILKALYKRSNAVPGENDRGRNTVLEIGCADKWMDEDGDDSCRNSRGTGSAAATESHNGKPKSTINFCPTFFSLPRFDQMKSESASAIRRRYHDEKYMGSDALTVVHELTHVWWIAETNEDVDEVYGFMECTELAWNCGLVEANNPEVIENADTYGFYAEYGYWRAKGIDGLWYSPEEDPVYLPVDNYE